MAILITLRSILEEDVEPAKRGGRAYGVHKSIILRKSAAGCFMSRSRLNRAQIAFNPKDRPKADPETHLCENGTSHSSYGSRYNYE